MHGAVSVYLHFPWCLRKCPYCDFFSVPIGPGEVPHAAYGDAVLRELAYRAPALEGRELASIFLGGGTPSLWSGAAIGAVIEGVQQRFTRVADDLEITVECNPTSLDMDGAAGLRNAGVNRLSVGVQSLDDDSLRFLGRLHDAEGALRSLDAAQHHFQRVSADMMFGLPTRDVCGLVDDVVALVRRGIDHVSLYSLTIEPDTEFGRQHAKKRLEIAAEEDTATMFERARDALLREGLSHYEVSSYARAHQQARHNQHYWRGGMYLGLGAGAVGCLHESRGAARRYRNEPDLQRYLQAPDSGRVQVFEEQLGPDEIVAEMLLLGLRTDEGVDLVEVERRSGVDPRVGRESRIEEACASGHLHCDGRRMRVPPEHWLQLDGIVAALF